MANTKTQEVIAGMLVENCGTNLLDSGDAYGRHFQRNQGRDFATEKSSVVEFDICNDKLDISMVHNLYHWLERRLELDNSLDGIFHGAFRIAVDHVDEDESLSEALHPDIRRRLANRDEKSWLQLMEEFPAWVAEHVSTEDDSILGICPPHHRWPREPKEPGQSKTRRARKAAAAQYAKAMEMYRSKLEVVRAANSKYREHKDQLCNVGGIYNEGDPITVNSANGEDMLSQVIQFVYFTWNNEAYIILQIHGGADVRGGYTKPRVFRADSCGDETEIFDTAKGHIFCTGKDHHPAALKRKEFQESQLALPGVKVETINFDDCNANWYTDDSCNFYDDGNCGRNYTNLEDMSCVDLEKEIDEHEDEVLEVGALVPGDWRPGVVCVLDGKAYCPHCGALLGAGE